jgi:hypothetical protein
MLDDELSRKTLESIRRHYASKGGLDGLERFNLFDFMHLFGSIPCALHYVRLFVPEFKVVAGHVLWDDGHVPEIYAKAVAESETGTVDPDSFNWVEVYYLFSPPAGYPDDDGFEEDKVLAELIAEAWRGRLLYLFPNRKFVVEIIPPEKTGSVTGVGFREVTG